MAVSKEGFAIFSLYLVVAGLIVVLATCVQLGA